ncbi:MAG TPA: Na+/H+ antiporter NhaC family protein [Ruminiclostridium sp.]
MSYGFISIFIPIIVIALAIFTKRIISSLIVGILAGGIMLSGGNIINGIILATEHLVNSVATKESVYIILFLFVFGAFGEIMKVSGGIKGFTGITDKFVKTEKGALGAVWFVSIVTFIDCCFHAIAAGTVGKALIEKTNGNKKKFAFVLNVTSCLLIILIPFGTTYVGYIVGVINSSLNKAGVKESAYELFIKSIPYNFYAIVMLLISIIAIIFNFGFTKNISQNTDGNEAGAHEHGDEAHEQCEFEEKVPPRPLNLILPLTLLIVTTFFFFWFTGKGKGAGFTGAIMNADFEKSIFMSALITLVITTVFYVIQKIPMSEIESHFLSGGNEMIPPIIVLILSWGLSSIVQDLGFTKFVTSVMGKGVPHFLIPAAIFLLGCAISYFMGSAWGTWALIMPIAIPIAVATNTGLAIIIGAVLAGGSLGDNASPLGETAVLSATIAEVPLMEHIKSELPYCLIGVGISTVAFIVFAILV